MQLGGAPDFAPDSLTSRSHAEYVVGKSLVDMIKEDLVAERIAIDSHREMIQYSAIWIRRQRAFRSWFAGHLLHVELIQSVRPFE